MKRFLIAILALLIAMSTVSCIVIKDAETTADTSEETEEETEEEKVYPHSNMELAPLDEVIATTEHLTVNVSTFKYFFMDEYSNFVNESYYNFSYYNFDENIPLHDQDYTFSEEPMTWYQVFLEEAKYQFEQYAVFAEMACKEGIALDEEDKAKIESNLKSIDDIAAEYSMTFEEYMAQFMGEGMTREHIKTAMELIQLGYKYYLKLYNEPQYTKEQIEEAYENSNGKYSLVDFRGVQIEALYDETDSDEQIEAAKNEAKTKAEKMKSLIDGGMSFTDAYNAVTAEAPADTTEETVSETPEETTEESTAETAEKTTDETAEATEKETEEDTAKEADTDKYLYVGMEYDNSDACAFLYDKSTVEGQVNITYDDMGNASVVQCVKLPYKNTQKSISVRHILLSSTDYGTEEEAYEMGMKLLQQINAAEDKKAEFISLVSEYSSDPGSNTNGGLYENVVPGAMVEEFNDWCFAEGRQTGDTGLVLTDYGYHVMYMEGFSDEMWYYNSEAELRSSDFNNAADKIFEEVKVTYNEELLDRITK